MARKVFFSFHYEVDNWRAAIVRNHGVSKPGIESCGYIDKAAWEQLERTGESAIKRWIDQQLHGTTVTAVLIGQFTHSRKWVKYEIKKSFERGNGLLGIRIHNVLDRNRLATNKGANPFDVMSVRFDDGSTLPMSEFVEVYDWVNDDGYYNFADWVEESAQFAEEYLRVR